MKKFILAAAAALALGGGISAQVMDHAGVRNTLWTGFGSPLSGDFVYYGFIDCIQARTDVGSFTLEGMINWGAIAHMKDNGGLDNFTFEQTAANPLWYHYNHSDSSIGAASAEAAAAKKETGVNVSNAIKWGQMRQDDYYVNFLWHPFKNFDVGAGTKLNWQVGPAPRYGAWLWEADAHVRQGGFSTDYDDRHGSVGDYQFVPDAPGSADVVGFVPYANKYAKKSIGVRYCIQSDESFNVQFGAAIPDGTNTDGMRMNAGAQFGFSKFNLAVAYEGLFQKDGNLYAGAEFGIKEFFFDVYGAWDAIDFDEASDAKNMSYSLGAAMTAKIDKAGITIRPEAAFNFFENSDYTPSWYAGGLVQWDMNEKFALKAFTSFAIGSRDKRWDNDDSTKDWITGNIFDLRPEVSFNITDHHSLAAYIDFENRTAFDGKVRQCWSTGVYWTYNLDLTSSKSAKTTKSSKSTK